ncbi:vasodilator-stimulated phosphoprotein-like [Microtus oregoni]|uniref:vasodilator-stimulated phosphoprotein-like n=1 Tax=Microtus oregoni TaxID=111838 RepID=UPI001BB2848F|nr:vasodilator-stimulated phosphoprotein-like [Microtus oregoni]
MVAWGPLPTLGGRGRPAAYLGRCGPRLRCCPRRRSPDVPAPAALRPARPARPARQDPGPGPCSPRSPPSPPWVSISRRGASRALGIRTSTPTRSTWLPAPQGTRGRGSACPAALGSIPSTAGTGSVVRACRPALETAGEPGVQNQTQLQRLPQTNKEEKKKDKTPLFFWYVVQGRAFAQHAEALAPRPHRRKTEQNFTLLDQQEGSAEKGACC